VYFGTLRKTRMLVHRNNKWVFFLIGIIAWGCDTASNVEPIFKDHYIKYYGGDGDEQGIDLIVNNDDTYIVMGSVVSPGGQRRIHLVKVGADGEIIWSRYHGGVDEYPQDIEPVGAGYVILTNVAAGEGNFDFKLIRVDATGAKIDSLVYDVLTDQVARTVTPLADGGFYVVGNTKDSDLLNTNDETLPVTEQEDLLFVRFDNTFTVVNSFEDRIGSSSVGSVARVFENADGGFIYAAFSDQPVDGEMNVSASYETNFIFRSFSFDPGNVSSRYIGDDARNEIMNQAYRSQDESIYAIGTSRNLSGTASSTAFITKVRDSSNPLDPAPVKSFENNFLPVGTTLCEGVSIYSENGVCLLLVNKVSDADGTRDICLMKANPITGDIESNWTRGLVFGTPANDDTGSVVTATPSGDILILGTFNLTNQQKMALIKVRMNGKFE
jgi:hypothetical protein